LPEDQTLYLAAGESTNPRAYDPATGGGDNRLYSGLVSLNPQLELVADLAAGWDISPDGTVYTFTIRANARFHNGRPVTAEDVVFSWERALDPATDSDVVLTYLGDIVGARERHAGQAEQTAGLKVLDSQRLQVTIDAPKPYFLMKLTYSVAHIVDRETIGQTPEWYRQPNGTGPYRLIRWEPNQLRVFERNEAYHLSLAPIRYIAEQIYTDDSLRMYERDEVDITYIGGFDLGRARDPNDPLHGDLIEGISLCTSYIVFDTSEPPFDDPQVRRAFALAIDRERYAEIVTNNSALPARGLYPPGLPGYSTDLNPQRFDPEAARQALAASRYGEASKLPPIVFTNGGFASGVGRSVALLIAMWEQHLGVKITIDNVEPNNWFDEVSRGNFGQLLSFGWCADFPDPENFADALFYANAQQNLGRYSNPALDQILTEARVERDVARRMQLYQQAEQTLVDDAAAIFLLHGRQYALVQPHVQGFTLTPLSVPIERYLELAPR
jgi:ABC-type transport system substrate-binding protein